MQRRLMFLKSSNTIESHITYNTSLYSSAITLHVRVTEKADYIHRWLDGNQW